MNNFDLQKSKITSKEIREMCLKINHISQTSHLGSSLSISDIINILFFEIIKLNKKNLNSPLRDKFILSKGHACLCIYVSLFLKKIINKNDLYNYGKNNSFLMTHISHKVPGVEFSTGSLGHGLPFATGKALYAKKFNKNWHTYCLLSDGELNEGSNWESLLFSSHHKLNNLTIIVDYNKIQSFGNTNEVINLEPLEEKFKSMNLDVVRINGHNLKNLFSAFKKKSKTKPKVIIADTIKGYGVDFIENKLEWHYKSLTLEQLNSALKILK
jgi:transketolase